MDIRGYRTYSFLSLGLIIYTKNYSLRLEPLNLESGGQTIWVKTLLTFLPSKSSIGIMPCHFSGRLNATAHRRCNLSTEAQCHCLTGMGSTIRPMVLSSTPQSYRLRAMTQLTTGSFYGPLDSSHGPITWHH